MSNAIARDRVCTDDARDDGEMVSLGLGNPNLLAFQFRPIVRDDLAGVYC